MARRLMTMLVGAALAVVPANRGFADEQAGPSQVGKGVNFYSVEKELALGRQLAADVERQTTIVHDPVIEAYVNRIGAKLARDSDARMAVTIRVIESRDVNAFALPGGFIFVNTGLILQADSEAELAGVIAHSVGDVAALHATRLATKGEIAQTSVMPLWVVGGWGGYSAFQAANVVIPASLARCSRAFVAEADLLGLDYMFKAGYDPAAFVTMLEKVQAMEKEKTSAAAFSTHPPTAERIAAAEYHISQSLKPKLEFVVDTVEFDAVKARLAAMPAPAPPKNPPTLRRNTGD